MKYIIIIISITFLFSCCKDNVNVKKGESKSPIWLFNISSNINVPSQMELEEVTLDDCEYYFYRSYYKFGLTHKGNCINHFNFGDLNRE